jgi:hypothetical protein
VDPWRLPVFPLYIDQARCVLAGDLALGTACGKETMGVQVDGMGCF